MRRVPTGVLPWHVFARGCRRLALYRQERDYREFFLFLREALQTSGCWLLGYALMENHYHLILRGDQSQLTKCMHRLNWRYALFHNDVYRTKGHVFEGPYLAYYQRTRSALLWRLAYVFLNPVMAGLAETPQQYPWSGYLSFSGQAGSPVPVSPPSEWDPLFERNPAEAKRHFQEILAYQRTLNAKSSPRHVSAREIQIQEFHWLLHMATERVAQKPGLAAEDLAIYWGSDAGIPPHIMGACLRRSSSTVLRRIRRFKERIQADARFAPLTHLP